MMRYFISGMVSSKNFLLLTSCFLLFMLSGCATVRTIDDYSIQESRDIDEKEGVYHVVKPGETLWRIAKTYGVSLERIVDANRLKAHAEIEEGQKIFIPGAQSVKQVFLDEEQNKNDFIWPLEGEVICHFHEPRCGEINQGLDIRAEPGEMIRAARTGRVVFADYLPGYGATVILDHEDELYTIYSQNAEVKVKPGDLVLKNTEIAQMGGQESLAYLHFEIRRKAVEENPLFYLP